MKLKLFAPAIAMMYLWPGESRAVAQPTGKPAQSRVALAQALAPLDGRRLRATVVELSYEPGGTSPAHSHPCPVLVYVIEGAIKSRVNGGPEVTYRAGESFYEAPHGSHDFSANASDRAPAKFLAVFVCDRETPLSVPPPGGK